MAFFSNRLVVPSMSEKARASAAYGTLEGVSRVEEGPQRLTVGPLSNLPGYRHHCGMTVQLVRYEPVCE